MMITLVIMVLKLSELNITKKRTVSMMKSLLKNNNNAGAS